MRAILVGVDSRLWLVLTFLNHVKETGHAFVRLEPHI
ncbi:MAG: hypothetical protein RLZZ627_254 [Pseudomonadota bacterium]|jgi:hypothetical protein